MKKGKAKQRKERGKPRRADADEADSEEGLASLPVELLLFLVTALDRDFPSLWALRSVCRTFRFLITSSPVLG